MALRNVDFPAPLAPIMAMVSPLSSDVDVVQSLEVAVEGSQFAGLQERHGQASMPI